MIGINTALVMGTHIDFRRGTTKYGSIGQMPQYPVMKRFAKEGQVTVFSIDKKDYSDRLPDNCFHYQIPNKLLFMLFSWLIIGLVARSRGIDYIYYHSASSMFALPFANKLSGAKSILFYGCMLWSSGQGYNPKGKTTVKELLLFMFEEQALRFVDYAIASSPQIHTILALSSFRGKILPIEKGVRNIKPEHRHKRNPKRIIFVGWLEPIKNPLLVISAFSKYVSDPDARLVVCGKGSMRFMCKCFTIFDKRIKLLGQRHDIPDQLAKSGIFVNCSTYEGHSDSIIEAMFSGLPVIASDVGGNSSIVRNGVTGRLFESGNHKQLGETINHFLENSFKAYCMGKDGKQLANKLYDINKNLNTLVKIMRGIKG